MRKVRKELTAEEEVRVQLKMLHVSVMKALVTDFCSSWAGKQSMMHVISVVAADRTALRYVIPAVK